MGKKPLFMLLFISLFLITCGCSTPGQASDHMDYEQTKKMVVDILKTDEGKKALREILSEKEFKSEIVMDHSVVSDSIQTTLVSDKGKDFWKSAFEDPDFAKKFAESMKDQNEMLLKQMLNDPEYREKMLELLHDPEMEKEFTHLLKSNEFRKHLESVITETFESPVFQAKIKDILLKAAEEQSNKEEKK